MRPVAGFISCASALSDKARPFCLDTLAHWKSPAESFTRHLHVTFLLCACSDLRDRGEAVNETDHIKLNDRIGAER